MKNLFRLSVKTVLVLFLSVILLGACNKNNKSAGAMDKDTSYSFGMYVASIVMQQMGPELGFDYTSFIEGFEAFYEGKETRLTPDQAMGNINAAITKAQEQYNERSQQEGDKNRADGEAYLAENSRRSGVTVTSSGLQYEVVTQGSGDKPSASDNVRVHYEGTFIDGTVFDSSYQRGDPAEFNLGGVIPGWSEAVQLMNEGSTYMFVIPSDLAYGPGGTGPIPPNATLIFKVELLNIIR